MNRVRMTMVYEFDYHGELSEDAVDRLHDNFMKDPTGFLHPHELEWDEIIVVDFTEVESE
jgi:hypothetical protein